MKSLRIKRINILLTAIVICISVFAVGIVYVPRILGFQSYAIETGSMSPTINQGSLVFVQKINDISEYDVGNIVTFRDTASSKFFTHRIVKINGDNSFETKGDANKMNDPSPTDSSFAVGKVEFSIPYVGYAVTFFKQTAVKIAVAVIYIAWAAIEIELYVAERKKHYE